jgi:hypothetical protein
MLPRDRILHDVLVGAVYGSTEGNYGHPIPDDRVTQLSILFAHTGGPALGSVDAGQHQQSRLMLHPVDLAGPPGAAGPLLGDELLGDVNDEEWRRVDGLGRFAIAVLAGNAGRYIGGGAQERLRAIEIRSHAVEGGDHRNARWQKQ